MNKPLEFPENRDELIEHAVSDPDGCISVGSLMNKKQTCKNCKYWQEDKGFMESHKTLSSFGTCQCPKFKYDPPNYNDLAEDEFVYCDMEHYEAYFETGAEFGCIHFEQKQCIM